MCVEIYAYIYACMYIYIYMHVYIYICMYIYIYMNFLISNNNLLFLRFSGATTFTTSFWRHHQMATPHSHDSPRKLSRRRNSAKASMAHCLGDDEGSMLSGSIPDTYTVDIYIYHGDNT